MEEVWKDLSLTTPSLSLLPLEPNTKSTGSKTTNASFSLTCQDLFRAPVTSCAQPFSPDNSEFVLERNLDKGITSASAPAEDTVDRRRKRVMKNRESAARSRARKQLTDYKIKTALRVVHALHEVKSTILKYLPRTAEAYTKQLQLEQGNLERENKKLKLQYAELQRELDAQAPPQQATRKDVLQRTLSGPY